MKLQEAGMDMPVRNPRVLQLPVRAVTRDDFARIVEFIERTEPDEVARCRMGISIARKLAGLRPACACKAAPA